MLCRRSGASHNRRTAAALVAETWQRNGRGQGRPPLAFPVTLLRLRSAGHDGVPGAAIATADCDCAGPACEAFPLGQA
jgi:hypothetical protein